MVQRVAPTVRSGLSRRRSWLLAQSATQAVDGGELVAPVQKPFDDRGQGLDGLAAVSAAIVQQHDRSGPGLLQDVAGDGLCARTGPVAGVDVPQRDDNAAVGQPLQYLGRA